MSSQIRWIDVHAHLEMLEIPGDEALKLSLENNVRQMITIGTHPEENKKVLAIARKHFPTVVCTLGIHPHEAKFYTDDVEQEMLSHGSENCVVGIGEIGLDYYYDHSDRAVQREVFRRQMDLASKLNLPIEIHTREAEEDTIEILKEYKGRVRGLFHCFSGTQWLATQGLDLGYDLSFSGIITFKSADSLRSVLKNTPLDRIHIETDSPYLTPVPHRGKKNNPSLLIHTAQFVSQFLNIPLEKLSDQVWKNSRRLFPRLPTVD